MDIIEKLAEFIGHASVSTLLIVLLGGLGYAFYSGQLYGKRAYDGAVKPLEKKNAELETECDELKRQLNECKQQLMVSLQTAARAAWAADPHFPPPQPPKALPQG